MVGLFVMAVLCALGAEGVDDTPRKIAGKSAQLTIPPPLLCHRTCMRVLPTPEMKEGIKKVMQNCHVPEKIVEIQRANLGRNAQKMEKFKFTAYMEDPADYWCIVSWESILNTNDMNRFHVDCNYECTLTLECTTT